MLYLLSGIIGSLLTIAFYLGGLKASKTYDTVVGKISTALDNKKEDLETTFSEPVTQQESFTNAKSVDDLLQQ